MGGGRIAAHKAEKVKPFGAKITIIAPDIMDKLKQDPAFMCEERPFVPEDIEGCAFVIAATDDRELNHRISALCQEKGILVNVVDDKDYCGFLFPSLVKEGKTDRGNLHRRSQSADRGRIKKPHGEGTSKSDGRDP